MTNRIREIIQTLPVVRIREIIKDYEQLESKGSIGDCYLRSISEEYIGKMSSISISTTMRDFAFEAYRFLALTRNTIRTEV